MKTTLEIADSLLVQAKRFAASRSISLRQVVEESLRSALEQRREQPFRLRDGSFGSKGLRQKLNWDQIRDEVYQGRGA